MMRNAEKVRTSFGDPPGASLALKPSRGRMTDDEVRMTKVMTKAESPKDMAGLPGCGSGHITGDLEQNGANTA